MNKKIFVGIDPGAKGFITVMDDIGIKFYAIPTIGGAIDVKELGNIFKKISDFARKEGCEVFCVIEKIHALYSVSAKSTFKLAYVCGMLEAFIVAEGFSYRMVPPKEWQSQMFKGLDVIKKSGTKKTDTKAMSVLAAKRLFPDVDLRKTERCRNPDDNKSDSLLMCYFAKLNS